MPASVRLRPPKGPSLSCLEGFLFVDGCLDVWDTFGDKSILEGGRRCICAIPRLGCRIEDVKAGVVLYVARYWQSRQVKPDTVDIVASRWILTGTQTLRYPVFSSERFTSSVQVDAKVCSKSH